MQATEKVVRSWHVILTAGRGYVVYSMNKLITGQSALMCSEAVRGPPASGVTQEFQPGVAVAKVAPFSDISCGMDGPVCVTDRNTTAGANKEP